MTSSKGGNLDMMMREAGSLEPSNLRECSSEKTILGRLNGSTDIKLTLIPLVLECEEAFSSFSSELKKEIAS
jgi:hypothetical protein